MGWVDAEVREETTSWKGTCHRNFLKTVPAGRILLVLDLGLAKGVAAPFVSHVIEVLP